MFFAVNTKKCCRRTHLGLQAAWASGQTPAGCGQECLGAAFSVGNSNVASTVILFITCARKDPRGGG